MNWSQFKDPVSHMCLAGTVVAFMSLTQEVAVSSPFYHPQQSWGKVIFSEACVKNSVHRGGRAWRGCVCGREACVAWGHVWQGLACMTGDMHGRGACVAGGHVWQRGVHGIWSMSRRYASYWNWNAF